MDARSLRVLNRETYRNEFFQRKTYTFPYVHNNTAQNIHTTLDPYNPKNNSNVKGKMCQAVKPTAVYLRYPNILAVDLSGSSIALPPSPADPTEVNEVSEVAVPLEGANPVAEPVAEPLAEPVAVTPVTPVTPVKAVEAVTPFKVPAMCCTIS
jgi:hypothetical protein